MNSWKNYSMYVNNRFNTENTGIWELHIYLKSNVIDLFIQNIENQI